LHEARDISFQTYQTNDGSSGTYIALNILEKKPFYNDNDYDFVVVEAT